MNPLAIYERLLSMVKIYQSERTKNIFAIMILLLFIGWGLFQNGNIKTIITITLSGIFAISLICDIVWKHFQKKYIIQKCPRISCKNIIKIKKIDDEYEQYRCPACGILFQKYQRNLPLSK
jgi:hypothetical protein